MKITVNPDLSAVLVTEDGLLECNLSPSNPETGIAFESEEEVREFIESIGENPNYFRRVPTAAEKAADFEQLKTALSYQIDAAVLAVYAKPMTLSKEYEAREASAITYKAANYPAVVPEWISDFATPAGMTAKAATDLILVQAAQMRGALQPLGKLRMQKIAVQKSTTEAGARAIHAAVMSALAAIAASLK